MKRALLACLFTLAVTAACAPPVTQILVPQTESDLRVRSLVSSLEVRDVSLPRYAASDEIAIVSESGGVDTLRNLVWADTPERAMTLRLADTLAEITGARVAGEPWPFADLPAAQLTVRVSEFVARPEGVLNFRGLYAVAAVDSDLADRSGRFDIAVPLGAPTPQGVANAQSAAVTRLGEIIARRIAR